MKSYSFEAWIHPEYGGDDYQVAGTIKANSLEIAKKTLEKALSKRSCIKGDYTIKED